MPWFVVDDSAHSHPKLINAGNAAIGLWMRCGSYAAQHLTDGIVPSAVAAMYGTRPQAEKLVRLGLWHRAGHGCGRCIHPVPGDYVMHDYHRYNPTRRQVLERRARAAEKKRKQRANEPPEPPEPDAFDEEMGYENASNRSVFDDESSRFHRADSDNAPAHGDASPGDSSETRARAFPSPPLTDSGSQREKGERSSARGQDALSLIDPEWQPSQDDIEQAQAARRANGRPVLTGQQLANMTRRFVRRQTSDQRTVHPGAWGARWQDWAERERPDDTQQQPLLIGLDGGKNDDLLWPHEREQQPMFQPEPWQTCDPCGRAYRGQPGLCRDCRQADTG